MPSSGSPALNLGTAPGTNRPRFGVGIDTKLCPLPPNPPAQNVGLSGSEESALRLSESTPSGEAHRCCTPISGDSAEARPPPNSFYVARERDQTKGVGVSTCLQRKDMLQGLRCRLNPHRKHRIHRGAMAVHRKRAFEREGSQELCSPPPVAAAAAAAAAPAALLASGSMRAACACGSLGRRHRSSTEGASCGAPRPPPPPPSIGESGAKGARTSGEGRNRPKLTPIGGPRISPGGASMPPSGRAATRPPETGASLCSKRRAKHVWVTIEAESEARVGHNRSVESEARVGHNRSGERSTCGSQ